MALHAFTASPSNHVAGKARRRDAGASSGGKLLIYPVLAKLAASGYWAISQPILVRVYLIDTAQGVRNPRPRGSSGIWEIFVPGADFVFSHSNFLAALHLPNYPGGLPMAQLAALAVFLRSLAKKTVVYPLWIALALMFPVLSSAALARPP